ncbi:hypothetical protein ABIC02_007863 [Bradyrhizobium sp. RT5a]
MGLSKPVGTTVSDKAAHCPLIDQRPVSCHGPELGVSEFTRLRLGSLSWPYAGADSRS